MLDCDDLAAQIIGHTPGDGVFDTPLARVFLVRSSALTEPVQTLYEPSFCLVAQGRKHATIGNTALSYDRSSFLVVGMDLPLIGAVVEAEPDAPYLCMQLVLDRAVLADLIAGQLGCTEARENAALGTSVATPELIDAATRLLRLIDAPDDAPVLAPLIEREILHRLLTGPRGAILRQIGNGESRLSQIHRAVSYIRQSYADAFTVEDLADIAGMSASTFHERFRAITSMSPLQFRNLIRLQEARRLMVMEGLTAAEAGFKVGYESPSQFSRDFVRVHKVSPRKHVEALRASGAVA